MKSIWLANDLTSEALGPWAHALRICATSATDLRVLHVRKDAPPPWSRLPTPRLLLAKWGFISGDASLEEFEKLSFSVRLQGLQADNPVGVLGAMIDVERPELLIVGTHRPRGMDRLFEGSVGEELARHAPLSTLVIPDGCRPFVSPFEGHVTLRTILIPVGEPKIQLAFEQAAVLVEALDAGPVEFVFLHIGPVAEIPQLELPEKEGWSYRTLNFQDGKVVGRVLEAAESEGVDLIAMGTHKHDSWKDSVFGSRTERVLRDAGVPVLIVALDG